MKNLRPIEPSSAKSAQPPAPVAPTAAPVGANTRVFQRLPEHLKQHFSSRKVNPMGDYMQRHMDNRAIARTEGVYRKLQQQTAARVQANNQAAAQAQVDALRKQTDAQMAELNKQAAARAAAEAFASGEYQRNYYLGDTGGE